MLISKLLRFLFGTGPDEPRFSVALFIFRLGLSGAMLTHGLTKLAKFNELWTTFPDPIGLGSPISVSLAIFAEVLCSFAVAAGFLTRLSVLPLITTMCVAFFIVHATDQFAEKELALLYLIGYVTIFLLGSGRLSLDALFSRFDFLKKYYGN